MAEKFGEEYELRQRTADMPEEADISLTVTDDCMEPYIPKGSAVYVQCSAAPGELEAGIFLADGKVVCRQWCEDYTGTLHLLAANPRRRGANMSFAKGERSKLVCLGRVLLDRELPMPLYDR